MMNTRGKRFPPSLLVLMLVAYFSHALLKEVRTASSQTSVSNLLTETTAPASFSYAVVSREFSFPNDHGAHPNYRSEWWYFTGNVYDENHRNYAFDITIFRFGLEPSMSDAADSLRASQIFLGHFAISDVQAERYLNAEKYSRELPGVTGISAAPVRIQLENWHMQQIDSETETWELYAATEEFGLNLELTALRPVALQGERGLSRKSSTEGNASYYYSIPKLKVNGELWFDEQQVSVSGNAWFDREWSTSALEQGQVGWDWFGLHLDDETELMYYQIRHANGKRNEQSHGKLFLDEGKTEINLGNDVTLQPLAYWRSPKTKARYPVAWRLTAKEHDLDLTISAKFNAQEWQSSFIYWEGSVSVIGRFRSKPVDGEGFLEMTGYDNAN